MLFSWTWMMMKISELPVGSALECMAPNCSVVQVREGEWCHWCDGAEDHNPHEIMEEDYPEKFPNILRVGWGDAPHE